MFVRARRQLVRSLDERARRAEAEQELLAEQARQNERARIAREMHDVVAHRLSLLSLHAGPRSSAQTPRHSWRWARGRTNAEIGRELFMGVATVKAHVSRLLDKLELTNRVQIALLVHDAALG